MPFFFYSTSLFTGTCTKACQKRCLISRSLSVLLVTRARSLVTVPGSVTGVVGFPISVPCDLTPPSPGDSPHLILWYKNIFGTPIYRCGQITITMDIGRKKIDIHQYLDELFINQSIIDEPFKILAKAIIQYSKGIKN